MLERISLAMALPSKENCEGWNPCLSAICIRIRSKQCKIVHFLFNFADQTRYDLTVLTVVSTSLFFLFPQQWS